MKKLLPAALFLMAVLTAPAQELPLLKWSSKDQQSLMKGTWWETHAPVLPPVEAAVSPVPSAPETPADADSPAVDPIPEDFTDVNEYFLPEYIRTTTGLIDPQKLLGEVERNDVIELIRLIKDRYNVNLFVSIFAAGQKVPPSVNAPTIARIKIMSNLDIAEHRIPQDGHFRARLETGPDVNVRVSILPTDRKSVV